MEAHGTEVLGVAEFKRRCLELLERTRLHGDEIVVTKRGVPIARVIPLRDGAASLRGRYRDAVAIDGDIVAVDWSEEWEDLP
jgi:prevent-host-death family protein